MREKDKKSRESSKEFEHSTWLTRIAFQKEHREKHGEKTSKNKIQENFPDGFPDFH